VEIGEERVYDPEAKSGVYEEAGLSFSRIHRAITIGGRFQHSNAGGSYGNHTAIRLVNDAGLGRAYAIALAVHLVPLDFVDFDRAERIDSYVQGDASDPNSASFDVRQDLWCEVKTGGGRGGGTGLIGEDRLVALLVLNPALYVRGEGNFPGLEYKIPQFGCAQPQAAAPLHGLGDDFRLDFVVFGGKEHNAGTGLEWAARPDERVTFTLADRAEEEHFGRKSIWAGRLQLPGDHPSIVQDQRVAGS
jgi:hypothetical protein